MEKAAAIRDAGAVRGGRRQRRAHPHRGAVSRARASTTPRSRSQPAIAPDDTVALTFEVAEGAQQVLQDVSRSTGNEVTQRQGADPGAALRARQAGRSRRVDAGAQAALRHQRLPPGRHPAGAASAIPSNGVQQVKAVVTVEEYPAVVGPLRLPARRRAPRRARRIHQHAQCRRGRRNPEPEPVRPRADRRRLRHVSARSPGRLGVRRHLAAVRLAGAIDALFILLARSVAR